MTKQREGYLILDMREAPPVPIEMIRASGLRNVIAAAPGTMLEAAIITCNHCAQQMYRNPDRTRERAWCASCDKYVCDGCKFLLETQPCKPIAQQLEEGLTAAEHALIRARE